MPDRELPQLSTQTRDRLGSRDAARLRERGRLPAVIYGHGQDPVHLSVPAMELWKILHEGAHLLEAGIDGQTEPCLVKEVQWDYLGEQVIHVDFARVDLTEEVDVEVEVRLDGEPPALEEAGAVLGHPNMAIEVRCRANNIPNEIVVDISELGIGDSITVGDVTLPQGVTAVSEQELVLARISIVEEMDDEEIPTEAASEEPEVIGRGPEEEEPAEEGEEPEPA